MDIMITANDALDDIMIIIMIITTTTTTLFIYPTCIVTILIFIRLYCNMGGHESPYPNYPYVSFEGPHLLLFSMSLLSNSCRFLSFCSFCRFCCGPVAGPILLILLTWRFLCIDLPWLWLFFLGCIDGRLADCVAVNEGERCKLNFLLCSSAFYCLVGDL